MSIARSLVGSHTHTIVIPSEVEESLILLSARDVSVRAKLAYLDMTGSYESKNPTGGELLVVS
jgi:hypothetical protein